jgi:Na+:H+ antiporter, NhaA family
MRLTQLFKEFFESEKAGGVLLIICTAFSLLVANSVLQEQYVELWHITFAGMNAEHWINEGLMAVFFLLIGLELKREILVGELADIKKALLPVVAALGGMLVPAGIFLLLNHGMPSQPGAGIPMATDIAFAIGILSLLGNRIPASLKILLTAIAVIDDLGAIIVIAVFYTTSLTMINLLIALAVFAVLMVLNRAKVNSLPVYLAGGIIMWFFMLHSGVHATIAGILLAMAIPFKHNDERSLSVRMQHSLHKPVAFFILPVFALANTAIIFDSASHTGLLDNNTLGIILGLVVGKPIGIMLFGFLAVTLGLCVLPVDLKWKQVLGIGFLAGIGFTMSIFITLLAFEDPTLVTSSKIAILVASVISGVIGFLWLKSVYPQTINVGKFKTVN